MAVEKIEDFGEKIGGARKDLAEFRKNGGFTAEQVGSWTDIEREKYIVKKELFPAPDYQNLVDEQGYSREAAYFIKKVLDALPTKPNLTFAVRYGITDEERRENIIKAQDTYIATINIIKAKLMNVKTLNDAANFRSDVDQSLKENDIALMQSFDRSAISKFSKATNSVSSLWSLAKFKTEMDKKEFLFTDEEKKLHKFDIIKYDGNNVRVDKGNEYNGTPYERLVIRTGSGTSYFYQNDERLMDSDNWKPDTYFLRFKDSHHNAILEINFPTIEDAQAFAIAYLDKEQEKQTEIGQNDKSDRKTRLVPPQLKHITRIGEDYREGRDVTGNMMLDTFSFRGGEFGNWENQNDRQTNLNMSYEAFKDLAKALNISDKDISLGGELSIAYGARGRGSALAHFEPARNVINLTKMNGAGSLGHEFGHALDRAIAMFNGRVEPFETEIWHGDLKGVMDAIRFTPDGHGNTNYYDDARCIDKMHSKCDKGYWHSGVELFARAFATYLLDKIEPNKCDYLCGHAEFPPITYTNKRTQESKLVYTYPRGEERERINAEFDKLIEKLKEKGMLHERPHEREHALIEQQDGASVRDVVLSDRIEKYNLDIDFTEIDYIEIKIIDDVYVGGIDDNGHEQKDNYRQTEDTILLYAASDKSTLLIYDESSNRYDDPISIAEALEIITKHLDLSANNSDINVYVKSNDGDYKLLTSLSEDKEKTNENATELAQISLDDVATVRDEADLEKQTEHIVSEHSQTEHLQNAKEAIDRIIEEYAKGDIDRIIEEYKAASVKEAAEVDISQIAESVKEAAKDDISQIVESVYEQYVQMSLDDYLIAPVEAVKEASIDVDNKSFAGLSEINAETAIGMIEYGGFKVYDENNALVTNIADINNESDTYHASKGDIKLYTERETIALLIDDISEAYRFTPQEAGEPYHLDLMRYANNPYYYDWDSFDKGKNVYQNVMIALQEGNFGVINEYLNEVCNSDRNSEYAKKASEVKDMLECHEVNCAFLEKCNALALDNENEGEYNSNIGFDPSKIESITKSKNEAEGYTVNGISGIPPEAASDKYIAYVDFGDGDKWFSKSGNDRASMNFDDALDGNMKCVVIANPIYKATEKQLDQLAFNDPSTSKKPKPIGRD